MLLGACKSSSGRYKGTKDGKRVKHHHGFFSANDKATRKNEKFKKKNSKSGSGNKTSTKTVKKSKAKSRNTYVKTFDHH